MIWANVQVSPVFHPLACDGTVGGHVLGRLPRTDGSEHDDHPLPTERRESHTSRLGVVRGGPSSLPHRRRRTNAKFLHQEKERTKVLRHKL